MYDLVVEYAVKGISPESFPIDVTIYPLPSFSIAVAVGSNAVVKSPSPPAKAPAITPNCTSVLTLTLPAFRFSPIVRPFSFRTYSKVISGTPPFLPPNISVPFKSL